MGSRRRQHHRQQESMREATAMTNRFEAQQRAYEEQIRRQTESMLKPPATYDAPDRALPSTLDTSSTGIRTARSTRGTVRGLSKGLASLRIPLNIGGGSGGGLNIG